MTETSSNNLFANLNQAPSAEAELESQVEATAAETSETDEAEAPAMSELEMLKNRARIMGIKFSNAIKVETLRAKIQAKLNEDDGGEQASDESDEEDDEYGASEAETYEAIPAMSVTTNSVPASTAGSGLLAQLALMSADEKAAVLALLGGTAQPVSSQSAATPVKPTKASVTQALREQTVAEQMALVRCRITNMDPKKKDLPGEIFTVANEFLGTVRKYVPYGEQTDDGYHIPVCIYNQLVERTFVSIRTVKNKQGRGTVTTTTDAREFAIEVLPPLTAEELARLANAQAAAAGN